MKKSIERLAALTSAALVLSACGGTTANTNAQDSSGLGPGPGFDGETIKVGVLNPTSGPLGAAAGLPILTGMQLRIDRVNEAGGINGQYPVELVVSDTKYDPQTAIQAYTGMSQDVVMVGSVLGTGVVQALLPRLAQNNMLAIPTTDDAAFVSEPHLLPTRPTYQAAFINGMAHLLEQPDGESQTYCTLRQDDASGEAYNRGITFGAEQLGVDIAADVAFPNDTTDFTAQIQQLKSAQCDVVFWALAAGFAQGIIAASVQLDFEPTWMSLASGVPLHLMESPSKDYIVNNFLVSTPGAQWGDESVPGMAELVEDYEKYGDPDARPDAALWPVGYDYAIAITTLLEAAVEKGDLTPESLVDISHSSDFSIDFQGLSPEFNYGPPESRTPPTEVTIFAVDPEVPGLLKTVERNVDSEAAQAFQNEG